jgi:ferredoxin, 2Fe-2S
VPKIVFVEESGVEHPVDATVGDSVMTTAVRNGVPGIIGECGGNKSCATCHVWVRPEFAERVGGPVDDMEDDLLDLGVADRRATSRLSCQIPVEPELDGLTLDLPPDEP